MRGHHTLPVLAALILCGCDGNSISAPRLLPMSAAPRMAKDTAVNGVAIDVSGGWQFHEDATFVLYDFSGDHSGSKSFKCSTDGTYTFVQTGATFSGSFDQVGVCAATDGTTFPNTFSGPVVGTIKGRHVRFEPPPGECSDEGELSPALDEMHGSGKCGGGGVFGTYRAHWSARRCGALGGLCGDTLSTDTLSRSVRPS